MPLRDHFHPPLVYDLPWPSFYTLWVGIVVRSLNQTLPKGEYRAFANLRLGPHVEADVAEFRRTDTNGAHPPGDAGGVATLPAAPATLGSVPLVFPDEIEVQIATGRQAMTLDGVIEFVSPGNKKEGGERAAFVRKCASLLQKGVGVMIVDVLTERLANLHNELMRLVGGGAFPLDGPTYVSAYAPVHGPDGNAARVWAAPCPIGAVIPAFPLYLRRGPVVVPDLDGTYTEALEAGGL